MTFGPNAARMWTSIGQDDRRAPMAPRDNGDRVAALPDALLALATPRSLGSGASLLEERGSVDKLYLLVSGWACRYATTRDGSRQILAILLPGDFCNLDGLALGQVDYGVRALTQMTALSIPRQQALAMAAENPALMNTLFNRLAAENALLGRWALCLGRKSATARLAHLLCELGVRVAEHPNSETVQYHLPLTQEQIADVLGLTAVHVNRTLQQLRSRGLVEMRGRVVSIPSVIALAEVGEFGRSYLHEQEVDWLGRSVSNRGSSFGA